MCAGHFAGMVGTETSGRRAARLSHSFRRKAMSSIDTYQHVAARSLIDSLGVDDALEFCRKNHWEGVVEAITNLIPRGAALHSTTMLSGGSLDRVQRRYRSAAPRSFRRMT